MFVYLVKQVEASRVRGSVVVVIDEEVVDNGRRLETRLLVAEDPGHNPTG